jgi:hypothetical protein
MKCKPAQCTIHTISTHINSLALSTVSPIHSQKPKRFTTQAMRSGFTGRQAIQATVQHGIYEILFVLYPDS